MALRRLPVTAPTCAVVENFVTPDTANAKPQSFTLNPRPSNSKPETYITNPTISDYRTLASSFL